MDIIKMQQRSCLVSIVGKPNAGKSTFLNRVINQKLSIVTPKPQTTRNVIVGIVTIDQTQLVFLDTPGIFTPQRKIDRHMVRSAWSSIMGANIVCALIDGTKSLEEKVIDDDMRKIIKRLYEQKCHVALLLTKIDRMTKSQVAELQETIFEEFGRDVMIFPISSVTGDGVDNIMSYIMSNADHREWLYEEDDITTAPMRFLASEITREKLLLSIQQEVPHHLTVETQQWKDQKNGSVIIHQNIIVERESHKKIILGLNGQKIKKISMDARQAINKELGIEAHLFVFVKVRKNWEDHAIQSWK